MNETTILRLVVPPVPSTPKRLRDICCLRYKRKGVNCPVCPLRPENAALAAAQSAREPRPAA